MLDNQLEKKNNSKKIKKNISLQQENISTLIWSKQYNMYSKRENN